MFSRLEIVTEATSKRLATVAALKAELNVADGASDPILARILDDASAACARFCNRVFARETVRETFRFWDGAWHFYLRRNPVAEFRSVVCDGQALAAVEYEYDAESGKLVRLSGGYPRPWRGTVIVEYDGGYASPGEPPAAPSGAPPVVPDDLSRACLTAARAIWFARDRDPLLRNEQILDVLNTGYGSERFGPLDGAAMLLEPYRRIAIG